MSLTYQEIWERYSHVEFKRRLYIKRLQTDGTYEASWVEISQGQTKDGSVNSISRSLPNDSWRFGYVTVNNVSLDILSPFQEFASENDPNSIFFGYIRHRSKFKVVDAFIDKYSNNAISNGGMESWSNGDDAAPDGWILSGSDAEVSKEGSIVYAGDYSAKITKNSDSMALYFPVSNNFGIDYWKGKEITFTCWAWCDTASAARLRLYHNGTAGTAYSSYHPGDSEWHQLTATLTVPDDTTVVWAQCRVAVDSKFAYFDDASIIDESSIHEASVTSFEGIIDATTAQTEQGYEKVTVLDYMSILNDVNVAELSLTETTLNALVYQILNRSMFTKYFNVSNSTDYINAGYNISAIDLTKYTGSVLEMLQDLAKGHSIFYIDPTDGYFYFKPADPTATTQYSFLESNNRKIDISAWREGIDRQVTNLYWDEEDAGISAVADPAPVNTISKKFKIEGVTNSTQRQNVLNYILTRTQYAKPYFKLVLPYFPVIKLLDRVSVQSFGSAPKDALRWGMFSWTSQETSNPNVAPRWRKPAGIRISSDDEWMVRAINHSNNLQTTLELEKIL